MNKSERRDSEIEDDAKWCWHLEWREYGHVAHSFLKLGQGNKALAVKRRNLKKTSKRFPKICKKNVHGVDEEEPSAR